MILQITVLAAVLAVGFALGRVKNAKKLAAVKAAVPNGEGNATADVKSVIADVKGNSNPFAWMGLSARTRFLPL